MVDIFEPEKRSQIMARIGRKNTKPELFVRKVVHSLGYRFRLHDAKLPGKPDIVLPRHRKVIFVNGCFWHGHKNCKRATLPKTNTDFWKDKIAGNSKRDQEAAKTLKKSGWKVMVIWQCQIGNPERLANRVSRYLDYDTH